MKLSQPLLKMIIKLIILMILFVCMFIISAFLYSTRYLPDVYNYINANITIKRIPTISEIEVKIFEVENDITTEIYSTTDADYFELSTTDDFDIDEFMSARFDTKTKVKRNVMLEEIKDYKELPNRPIFVDYIFLEEPLEVSDKNNDADDEDISRTMIRKEVIDNETKIISSNDNIKDRNLDEGPKEYLVHHTRTTTAEGYLVGDEFDNDVKHKAIDKLDITTDKNEPYFDGETDLNLLTDLVDVRHLSTRSPEDVEMITATLESGLEKMDLTDAVFPWVVTIFIKNSTGSSQFHYFCDGALLSEKVILTGGRCVQHASGLTAPENILVFLGKTNLKTMGGKERLHRIKKVVLHQNYTVDDAGRASHDLAILVMELPAELNERIQSACVDVDTTTESQAAVTTAWGPNGQLLPVFFEKEQSEICLNQNENVFCASYSSKIPLCPSYGGVYATKRMSKWCVQGIFYGDPANKGVCFNNNVLFTSLRNYMVWIDDFIVIHSDIL